ncbi:uncharacterized protein [Lolium perenne]|uniref:uncharacterized protein n=1 Tax=Lolium perenne TaxID=4522 RepID=UPI0021F681F1|nr:uncharacterized protein LOC127330945 [Lolium perenne]
MAMRSLLRKGPALARALGSPAFHAPSPTPTLRPRSPTFQAVQPAAGSRSLSQGQGAAAEEMGEIRRRFGEVVRAGIEEDDRTRKKLKMIMWASNAIIILSVTSSLHMLNNF